MPNAQRSRALAMLLVWMSVTAALLVAVTGPSAASDLTVPGVTDDASRPIVSMNDEPVLPSQDPPTDVFGKIAPELQDAARNPQKGLADVVVHTMDVPELSKVLEAAGARLSVQVDGELRSMPFVARPWGAVGQPTSLRVQVPQVALVDVAASPNVLFVDTVSVHATTSYSDEVIEEERRGIQTYVAGVKAGIAAKDPPVKLTGTDASASPTSWAIAREHKAWDAWQLGYQGQGVNVAVVDTGEDFGHPSLQGQWAVDQNLTSPWYGWPIMFHPASMEGLMGNGFWTVGSDLDRLPLPFWLSANDGDSWYTNTDYRANDTDQDGDLLYQSFTTAPNGEFQYTPRGNPQGYDFPGPPVCVADNTRINRQYYIGGAGLPGPAIVSQSGTYRLGVNRDDTLTGFYCGKVGVLVVDENVAGVYDTVYVDLNFDFNFTNDKRLTQADPIAVADVWDTTILPAGGPGQDGVDDISGGLLYFIASSQQITGEVVISNAVGTETSANLANGWVAVDMNGFFSFFPATNLWLVDPLGFPNYFPGMTEDIYEEFAIGTPIVEDGTTFDLGTGSFGPENLITFQSVPTDVLLRGPGPNFAVLDVPGDGSYFYDAEQCNPSFTQCTPLALNDNYTIDPDTGTVRIWGDIPDTYVWFFIYQLDTYILESVAGEITLSRAMPAGWDLVADYQTGLPIPYSQVYGPNHGYDTFIPANGDMVAFHGEFDYGQSHGSFVTSTVAATPFGNLASGAFEVFGTAPKAKIIGIAACCNTPGPVGLFGSIEDQRTFAALGYDGVAGTGDEAAVLSNSFGDPRTLETGLSWEDRWLIDFWNRYPELTTLIAMGNNGPGYATSAPGGSSPGVIGVGAGNSGDYRVLFGFDGGDAGWTIPVCPGPPPIDPASCVGLDSPFGPGPYGDPIYFSSRGPTLLGGAKPDIMSIGAFGLEAAPLNVYCCDGNFAFDLFSGTSQATPVTAGVTALIVQAYRAGHGGADPTNNQVKALLKSGADDIQRDVLQQGAGWTNALRSVEMAEESNGVSSNVDSWLPGNYGGTRRLGFVNLLPAGGSDSATITLTNHNPLSSEFVQIQDAVYTRSARYTYSFSLPTGTAQFRIIRPTGTYGGAGVYAANGSWLEQAMPFDAYWTSADFVKATFTYNAVAYPGATSWRLDTFNWYDSNPANGIFDPHASGRGFLERNRMTVAVNGGGAHSVWESIYDPDGRIIDGWVLNPRGGAAAAIPATLILEFYEKTDWGWVSTSVPSRTIPASGSYAFTVTANVPAGTPPGMYEGGVYVTDSSGDVTTIPVLINVPVSTFPVTIGGNIPATSLYDNNGMVQGSRSTAPWRQTGDSRYVYADFTIMSNIGRNVLYQAVLTSTISDPEMFVYALGADAAWTDDAIYGPGTFSLFRRTVELIGSTKSNFMNMDLLSHPLQPPPPNGPPTCWDLNGNGATDVSLEDRNGDLVVNANDCTAPWSAIIAFQVKAWGSIADVDPMQANIGIMETFPTTVSLVKNTPYGVQPISVWADVPMYNGIDTLAASTTVVTENIAGIATQDDPNNFRTATAYYPRTLTGLIQYQINLNGLAGDDLDLFLVRDNAPIGILGPEDPIACGGCSSAGATAVESITYSNPPDGTYIVVVHGWSVPTGTTPFPMALISSSLVILASAYTDRNAPTTTVAPNTPSGFNLEWRHQPDAIPATESSFLFVSPAYAPLALVQLLSISWVYDVAAPTINVALDLSPLPNSIISVATAGIVANIADSRQVDRFSPQLWVDGVDVTGSIRILAPYIAGAGYTLVTVSWEHTNAPWDDGRHTAILNVRDVAGNLKTQVWSWVVDTTGPAIAVTSPATDSLTSAGTWPLEAETEPGATVAVTVNGVPATFTVSPEGRISGTLTLAEGANDIVVTAEDALLNVGTATRLVTRDSIAPVVTASADILSPTNARSTTVSGTVDEDITTVWVNGMAAGVAADGSFEATVPLVEGTNPVQVIAWDAAGNQRVANLPSIVRDTIAPTITAELRVNGAVLTEPVIDDIAVRQVEVSGSAPDLDVFFVTINGQSVGGGGAFSQDFDLAVGDNVFVVQAVDDAGNLATFTLSVSYSPVVIQERANYNSIIASGVAVVLLIVGFVVGFLLSGRGGGPETPPPEVAGMTPKEAAREEEELPGTEAPPTEEEEL